MPVKGGTGSGKRGTDRTSAKSRFPFPVSLFPILLACATVQEPPGGPPDFTPPVLLSITPDSGAVVPELDDALVIRFNEVIAERGTAPLDQLVLVSPRPRNLSVSWRREAIAVRPREGWRRNTAYRVTLLPGITDLRNNRLTEGRTIVFSTGGEIPRTSVAGRVIDWETGTAGGRALVELTRLADSLVFWDVADSSGAYSVTTVAPGDYVLFGTIDRNSNRRRDFREPYDSVPVRLDSTLNRTLWTFVHDSAGPRLRTVTRVDSITIRLEFNQSLAPAPADSLTATVQALPDSTPVPIIAVLTQAAFDSARVTPRADSLAPDSAAAIPDPAREPPRPVRPGAAPSPEVVPDSALLRLIAERPRLAPVRLIRLGAALQAGSRYLVSARAANANGAVGQSSSVLVLPAAPAPPRDSLR